jgi:hypothetical protein
VECIARARVDWASYPILTFDAVPKIEITLIGTGDGGAEQAPSQGRW